MLYNNSPYEVMSVQSIGQMADTALTHAKNRKCTKGEQQRIAAKHFESFAEVVETDADHSNIASRFVIKNKNRIISAILHEIPAFQDDGAEDECLTYPDESFIFFNFHHPGAIFEDADFCHNLYYCAAVHILDLFRTLNKNDELYKLLASVQIDESVLGTFESINPAYDKNTIAKVMQILIDRSEHASLEDFYFRSNETPLNQDIIGKDYNLPENCTGKQRFEKLFSLLSREYLDGCVDEFYKHAKNIYRTYYKGFRWYDKKEYKVLKLLDKSAKEYNSSLAVNNNSLALKQTVDSYYSKLLKYNNTKQLYSGFAQSMCIYYFFNECKNSLPEVKDVLEELLKYEVEDPYRLYFTGFYLMAIQDDLFWCLNLYIAVLSRGNHQLPCMSTCGKTEDTEVFNLKEPYPFEMPDSEKLLHDMHDPKVQFRDESEENDEYFSYSQWLYYNTGVEPSRLIETYKTYASEVAFALDHPEYARIALTTFFELADKRKLADEPSGDSIENAKPQKNAEEHIIKAQTSQIEDLEKENDKLRAELAKAKQALKTAENEAYEERKKNKDYQDTIQDLSDKCEETTKELSELRTMIHSAEETDSEFSFTVDFPYNPTKKYVILGGHNSFLRSIKRLLPNVKYVDRDDRPNVNLLLNADAVWCQSNAIPHSLFTPFIEKARLLNIPFLYFSYCSAEKCAEQLVEYDKQFDSEEGV